MSSMYKRRLSPLLSVGTAVDNNNLEEVIKVAKLDYEVGLRQAFISTTDQDREAPTFDEFTSQFKFVPNTFATYRTDNKVVFGNAGSMYEVVQNEDVLKLIDSMVDLNVVTIESAGSWNKGANMFVNIKLNDSFELDNDQIDSYLLFTNSHDGSSGLSLCITNLRIACCNMIHHDTRTSNNKITLRHTSTIHHKLDLIAQTKTAVGKFNASLSNDFVNLAKTKLKIDGERDILNRLLLNPHQLEVVRKEKSLVEYMDSEIISTKLKNNYENILNYIYTGVAQDLHDGSALWVYNGISSYYHNQLPYKSEEARLDGLLFKSSQRMITKAYQLCTNLIQQ